MKVAREAEHHRRQESKEGQRHEAEFISGDRPLSLE